MQYSGGKTRIANEIAQYISAYGGISNEIRRREIENRGENSPDPKFCGGGVRLSAFSAALAPLSAKLLMDLTR